MPLPFLVLGLGKLLGLKVGGKHAAGRAAGAVKSRVHPKKGGGKKVELDVEVETDGQGDPEKDK